MEAIILAGGLGTRLRSVVKDIPKCMAPVNEHPFLWYLLKYLSNYPITKVILSVGYLREVIFEWVEEHQQEFPFTFDYAIEEEPLGTGGGIKLALEKVTEDEAIILNGDTFFNVDLNELMNYHHANKGDITLALKPLKQFSRYGSVNYRPAGGTITSFNEKKYCEEGLINGGIYVISQSSHLFDNLPQKFSFETSVLEPQSAVNKLHGIVQNGYFIDIGIPEDYKKANNDFSILF